MVNQEIKFVHGTKVKIRVDGGEMMSTFIVRGDKDAADHRRCSTYTGNGQSTKVLND